MAISAFTNKFAGFAEADEFVGCPDTKTQSKGASNCIRGRKKRVCLDKNGHRSFPTTQDNYKLSTNSDSTCLLVSLNEDCAGCIWNFLTYQDLFSMRSTCSVFTAVSSQHSEENTLWSHDRCHDWWSPCQNDCSSKNPESQKVTPEHFRAVQKLSPNLKKFELTDAMGWCVGKCRCFSSTGCPHFTEEVSYVCGFRNLRSLTVNSFKYAQPRAFTALIQGMTKTLQHLRELTVQLAKEIDLALLVHFKLEKLTLSPYPSESVKVTNLDVFLQEIPSLNSISITNGQFHPGLAESLQHAGELNLLELRVIHMCDLYGVEDGAYNTYKQYGVGDDVVAAIWKTCKHLKKLDVSGLSKQGISSAGLEMVLKMQQLEAVDLTGVQLDALYPKISHNVAELPNLKCLIVQSLESYMQRYFRNPALDIPAQSGVFSLVKKAQNLEKLDVRGTSVRQNGMFDVLMGLKALKDLAFSPKFAPVEDVESALLEIGGLPSLRHLSAESYMDDTNCFSDRVKRARPELFVNV